MKIQVEPSVFRVPGKGDVTINQLEVLVSSYSLNAGATAYYDLQTLENVPLTRPIMNPDGTPGTETYSGVNTLSYGLAGNASLTQTQFNNWGTDDDYFVNCIAENLGLTPV
jgi:hypothetical protein